MYFDRLDICTAHYLFAMLFHQGQFSEIYAKFGQLEKVRFKPSPLLSNPKQLNENAKEIYMNLVRKHIGVLSTNSTCT
jgi:hypothetical protein